MQVKDRIQSNLTLDNSPFNHGVLARKRVIVDSIRSQGVDLKNKKVLVLAGGVGRNAHAIQETFDCDVTNSDIEPLHIEIGSKVYPSIKHMVHDYNSAVLDGYDFVIHEGVYANWYNWNALNSLQKWQGHVDILPKKIAYKVYKFNCSTFKDYYHQVEAIGERWVAEQLASANVELRLDKSHCQDLEEQTFELEIADPEIEISNCDTHDYQMIGYDCIGLEQQLRGLFINRGMSLVKEDGIYKTKTTCSSLEDLI